MCTSVQVLTLAYWLITTTDRMKKIANLSLGICGASIALPRLFILFAGEENTLLQIFPWGGLILISGILGVSFHLWEGRKEGLKFSLQSLILFLSLLLLFVGFAGLEFQWENAKFILLIGVITLGIWLIYPNKKKEE